LTLCVLPLNPNTPGILLVHFHRYL
jgi:hypothetical protein